MFKSVLIIIFVIIVLLIARTLMQRLKKPAPNDNSREPITHNDTVQCLQCKTYIPREDAILKGDNAFCSAQHLNDWNPPS